MTFGVLGPYLDTTTASATKLNGQSMISGAGADLATLSPSIHKLVHCTASGSGFTVEHTYVANSTSDAYIDITGGGTAVAAATQVATLAAYSKVIDTGGLFTFDFKKAKWIESVSGTGAITDDVDGTTAEQAIKLASGATSGGRSAVTQIGLMQDFSKRSFISFKSRIGTLSSMNCRGGVNCDLVTSADSNTVNYAAEICTATNNNWYIRSATASATSASNTAITATTNRVGIKLEHYPDLGTPAVLMYIDAAAAVQKTSNIPTTGTGTNNNVMRFSNKNSTSSDRPWFVYGCRLVYTVSGAWV